MWGTKMPILSHSQRQDVTRHLIEFWVLFFLPWILDFLGGRGVQNTVFGAALWGLFLLLTALRAKTQDKRLKYFLGYFLLFSIIVWFFYWFRSLSAPLEQPSMQPAGWDFLKRSHAALLAAAAGMVLLWWTGSLLWLIQEYFISKKSWERRNPRWTLPSLESLSRFEETSFWASLFTWSLGFFLALASGLFSWQPLVQNSTDKTWLLDPKVLVTSFLFFILIVHFQMSLWISKNSRTRHRLSFLFSSIFLGLFFTVFMLKHYSALHEPLSWFLK